MFLTHNSLLLCTSAKLSWWAHKTNENIEIREELIGFRHAKSIRGERIADIIVQFLNEVHLDIRNVRAQCYDGLTTVHQCQVKLVGFTMNIRCLRG
jgi:hypothetical protein